MDTKPQCGNQLLAFLKPEDLDRIAPDLTHIDLPQRMQLEIAGEPVRYVYFPGNGVASVVVQSRSLQQIEVGVIGKEGVTGLSLALGADRSRHSTFIQLAGQGWRLDAAKFGRALSESRSFQRLVLQYTHTMLLQLSSTALANGRQSIERRLARWLLMAEDRMGQPSLALTQEFLSVMLGVRRPGVTATLKNLHNAGLIDTQRGYIEIKSREGLQTLADGSYGIAEEEYRRLFPVPV